MSTTPIVQFGTSRFPQAHADLFISDAMARGKALGSVTVVQSSGDPARAQRLAGLVAGYLVRIRRLENGAVIEGDLRVTSVSRGFSTASDLPEIERIIAEEAEIILSNTSEAGFTPRPADRAQGFEQGMSYPAKLAHLLRALQGGWAPHPDHAHRPHRAERRRTLRPDAAYDRGHGSELPRLAA